MRYATISTRNSGRFFSSLIRLLCWPLAGLLALGNPPASQAQAPAWSMAAPISGLDDGYSLVNAIAVDEKGNAYLAGSFAQKISLDNTVLLAPTRAGGHGTFVAKWNASSRRFQWAHLLSTYAGIDTYPTAVALRDSLVYVGYGSSLFSITDGGDSAVVNWAQNLPGVISTLAVSSYNIYLAGYYRQQFAAGSTLLTSSDQLHTDIFVARYADNRTEASLIWVQGAGGLQDDVATALAISGTDVYVGGDFSSLEARFGNFLLSNANKEESTPDGFVAKLTETGATARFAWVVPASSQGFDHVRAVAVQGSSVYVAANLLQTARLSDTGSFGPVLLDYQGQPLLAVAKLTDTGATGRVDWVNTNAANAQVAGMAAQGRNIYLTGTGSSALTLGGYALSPSASQPPAVLSNPALFVAKLVDGGAAGHYQWVQGTGHGMYGESIAVGGPGPLVYLTGYGTGRGEAGSFGGFPVTGPAGAQISFVAGLRDDPSTIEEYLTDLADLNLFPNPASGSTTLRLPAVPGAAQATIRWYSTLGQLVRTQTMPLGFPDTTLDLPLAGLAPRAYCLRIEAGTQHLTRTLVVK